MDLLELLTISDPLGGRLFKATTSGGLDSLDAYTLSDPAGGRRIKVSVISASGGSGLFLDGGSMSATLRSVEDAAGTNSPLQLSTSLVKIDSNLIIGAATSASARLHVKGDGTNPYSRFEDSSGSRALIIKNQSGLATIVWETGGSYIQSDSTVMNFYSAGPYTGYGTWTSSGNYVWTYTPTNNVSATTGNHGFAKWGGNLASPAGSANFRPISIEYSINNSGVQTGGATATGIFLNAIETNLNGMSHFLMDLQRGGVSQFSVQRNGIVTATSHINTSGDFVATSTTAQFKINDTKLARGGADGVFRMSNNAETGFTALLFAIGLSTSIGIYNGSGSPESVVTANVGSLYLRTNGGAGTTLYVKESGTGNTGWVAK